MQQNKKILSIAIPTYNRSHYLELLLASILRQYDSCASLIEIIISDNASTDTTNLVVNKYIEYGLEIQYVRNSNNLGADRNIAQAFMLSSCEYVWVMGDDDYFLDKAIITVLDLIQNNSKTPLGIIYLNATSDKVDINSQVGEIEFQQNISRDEFVKKINVFLTFISGNVVNKKIFLNNYNIESINQYMDTNLVQLGWIYRIIINSNNFAIIDTKLLFAQADNSGGYNIFNVFAVHQSKIARAELNKFPKYIAWIEKGTMLKCFPVWIYLHLCEGLTTFDKYEVDIFQVLQRSYGKYYEYWIFIYPMKFMPNVIRRIFKKIVVSFWNFSVRFR